MSNAGNIEEVFSRVVIKEASKVKALCRPLQDCLNISLFSYASIDQDGVFVNLTNAPDELEPYLARKYYLNDPHILHPRLLRSGSLLIPVNFNPEYMQKIFTESKMAHLLLLMLASENRAEFFFFGNRKGEKASSIFSFGSSELLYHFARYFRREAKPIIERHRREGFNMKKAKGKTFLENNFSSPLLRKEPRIQRFLNLMMPLSNREMQCLELFKAGKTAQMTGSILGLSQRTVEHYFEHIKQKLNCYTKTELLEW